MAKRKNKKKSMGSVKLFVVLTIGFCIGVVAYHNVAKRVQSFTESVVISMIKEM
jgi:hypothetical protein